MTKEKKILDGWLITIGLEIHVQINSKHKLFSYGTNSTKKDGVNAVPNSQVSLFDLGIPGTMPKFNKYCVIQAIKTGLALNSEIALKSHFDRKHYFYPDLANGFQITQYTDPILIGGYIQLKSGKKITIHHIHLEADAGQLHHKDKNSLVNWNRSVVGLMEIVTNPDMESIEECIEFIKKLHLILQYTESSNVNMEEGNFRVDVNLSIRKNKDDPLGNRVEIKNMNSFKFIEEAIKYEIKRQGEIVNSGQKVQQETRGFDDGITYSMRDKETAPQYRYMREYNLPSLIIPKELVDKVKKILPELPEAKFKKYKQLDIEDNVIDILLENQELQKYFEATIALLKDKKYLCVSVSNWIIGDLYGFSNKLEKDFSTYPKEYLISILENINDEKISGKIGKYILEKSLNENLDPMDIVTKEDLWQITDIKIIDDYIQEVLKEQAKKYAEYEKTKDDRVVNFLVGCVIKKTNRKGSPTLCKNRVVHLLNKAFNV